MGGFMLGNGSFARPSSNEDTEDTTETSANPGQAGSSSDTTLLLGILLAVLAVGLVIAIKMKGKVI